MDFLSEIFDDSVEISYADSINSVEPLQFGDLSPRKMQEISARKRSYSSRHQTRTPASPESHDPQTPDHSSGDSLLNTNQLTRVVQLASQVEVKSKDFA